MKMRYVRNLRCAVFSTAFAASYIFVSTALSWRAWSAEELPAFFPKGVALGMSMEDLQKGRPDAKEFRIAKDTDNKDISTPSGDQAKRDHLFIEELSADSEFSGATYLVRNGALVCITVSKNFLLPKNWYLKPIQVVHETKLDFRTFRQKTFAECRKRFGDEYRIEAVLIQLPDTVNYLVPRFHWVNGHVGVAFYCTSEYHDVTILQPFVTAATWLAKDNFAPPLPPAQEASNELLSRLAQPLLTGVSGTK